MTIGRITSVSEQVEQDLEYWNELAHALGWRVLGFSYRIHATFETDAETFDSLQMNWRQRDAIMDALRATS